MKNLILLACHLATTGAVLALAVVAGAAPQGQVTATTSASESLTATSSTTSSTDFVSGGIGECEFDLLLADGGTFESISLVVEGPLLNTRCKLASSPQLAGASLQGSARQGLDVTQVSQPLPSGTVLLHCDSDEFIEGKQTVTVDFLDVEATTTSAAGTGGEPVAPPRLCATGISCSYYGGGDLDWDYEPNCGDANYDRRIRVTDALAALRTSVGHPSCAPVQSVCDPNGDLQVSAADALLILRASVGVDVVLQCPVPCHPGSNLP